MTPNPCSPDLMPHSVEGNKIVCGQARVSVQWEKYHQFGWFLYGQLVFCSYLQMSWRPHVPVVECQH